MEEITTVGQLLGDVRSELRDIKFALWTLCVAVGAIIGSWVIKR